MCGVFADIFGDSCWLVFSYSNNNNNNKYKNNDYIIYDTQL